MRRVTLDAPFTAGIVTDIPSHRIGPQASAFAQDGFSPQGLFMQRKGWAFDGTTADAAVNLRGVYRNKFILADAVRTLTSTSSEIYIHNPSSAGTALGAYTGTWLPRCVYNDELIFCDQSGYRGIIRFAGVATAPGTISTAPGWTSGEATLTGATWTPAASSGHFIKADCGINIGGVVWLKIVAATSTSVTIKGARAGSTQASLIDEYKRLARAIPCVSVYEAGTVNAGSTNVITGFGTKFTEIPQNTTNYRELAILVTPQTGNSRIAITIANPASDTSWSGPKTSTFSEKSAYQVLAPMPFKDVAAHKESLWGTGVAQYPNRVYVGPPGWDISFPPGFELPFDPTADLTSPNANDFLMDFIDVPSPFDGDANVAILASPNPLLVLKRNAVYGIFGAYGGLSVDLIADGVGCIDIRSAQGFDEGQFFASEQGIMWYVGGQLRDLTAGKINREWRALVRDFDYGTSDYCSIGLTSGHLIVHVTTGGGATQRTYLCDLRDQSWQSRLTNVTPRYMFTSRIAGEREKLLAVQDANQGRVLDLAPMIHDRNAGVAKDGDGDSPRMRAWTTDALGRADGIEGNTRLVDLDIHANVYDAGAAGSTKMAVQVVSGGGTENQAATTKTLSSINSDTEDRIDRSSYRVGRQGRFHQVRLDVDTVGTNTSETKVEVAQIVATVRDSRRRA